MIEATQEDPVVKENETRKAAIDLTMTVLANLFCFGASDEAMTRARKQIEALCSMEYAAGRMDGGMEMARRLGV